MSEFVLLVFDRIEFQIYAVKNGTTTFNGRVMVGPRGHTITIGMGRRPISLPLVGLKAHTSGSGIP